MSQSTVYYILAYYQMYQLIRRTSYLSGCKSNIKLSRNERVTSDETTSDDCIQSVGPCPAAVAWTSGHQQISDDMRLSGSMVEEASRGGGGEA